MIPFNDFPPTLAPGYTGVLLGNAAPRMESSCAHPVTEMAVPVADLAFGEAIATIIEVWSHHSAGGLDTDGSERVPPLWVWTSMPDFTAAIAEALGCPSYTEAEARAAWVRSRTELA